MPLSGPSAAARKAAFTASIVVARSTSTTRSVKETSGVGTRTEMPSIFPFTSGITSPVAFAAPVVVGICESAAARASQILVRQVENVLIVGVAVDRRHRGVPEAEGVTHDLHHGRDAVR